MKLTPWPDLPITIEPNGDDGYALTRTDTGARKAYAIARPDGESCEHGWNLRRVICPHGCRLDGKGK